MPRDGQWHEDAVPSAQSGVQVAGRDALRWLRFKSVADLDDSSLFRNILRRERPSGHAHWHGILAFEWREVEGITIASMDIILPMHYTSSHRPFLPTSLWMVIMPD